MRQTNKARDTAELVVLGVSSDVTEKKPKKRACYQLSDRPTQVLSSASATDKCVLCPQQSKHKSELINLMSRIEPNALRM